MKRDSISFNELKALSLATPNDMEFGGKIREMLWYENVELEQANTNVGKEGGIFGKIKTSQYKDLIEGYQNKKGVEFSEWYGKLTNEEKVFLSNMFD